jgi:hypothetical protein
MSNKKLLRVSLEGDKGSVVRVFETDHIDFLDALEAQVNHALKTMGYEYFEFKVLDLRPETSVDEAKGSKDAKK